MNGSRTDLAVEAARRLSLSRDIEGAERRIDIIESAQLERADEINDNRFETWNYYQENFKKYADSGRIEIPFIPDYAVHNAHMFYIKLKDLADRTAFISHMKERDINCVFHYIPLHSAPAGRKFGRFHGEDVYTTIESEKLVRLPLYYGITEADRAEVVKAASEYLNK